MKSGKAYQSWGLYPRALHQVKMVDWRSDALPPCSDSTLLPFGLGRSYGDSCLNDGNTLLDTTRLDRFISFDESTGLLKCEAGVSFADILRHFVPRGWFLPTTPGTKFVTLGGAIANDVHGKNHHRAGTIGCHITQFELLRSDGTRLVCSQQANSDWFSATIGGLGLTGLITWAELQLRRIHSPMIEMETIRYSNLDEFFELSEASDADFEHTVSWIDTLARGKALGRGHFIRGNHANTAQPRRDARLREISVPCFAPEFALNHYSIRIFNLMYYHRQMRPRKKALAHYAPFFYPLDSVHHWNRIYGRRGFFQYQFVVSHADRSVIRELLSRIAASGKGSFLAVLKTFGSIRSPGMLSFPRPGVTVALDFANTGSETFKLLEELDAIVKSNGGAVYPAKDARMSGSSFKAFYPNWETYAKYVDPHFSSSFWRRVMS